MRTVPRACVVVLFFFVFSFSIAGAVSETVLEPSQKPLHMTLLAVQDVNNTLIGNTADLFLEIRPGHGRVFLETFPLTKIDTQISTRFAKEVACNYFDLNCENYDFIYTIRSDSTIIGGPSAGAALAILTAAGMLGFPLREDVAVTGTINSGGVLGPVGGLRAKIDAAHGVNSSTVLIPAGTRYSKEKDHLDLVAYGAEKNISVVETGDLSVVLRYFTGHELLVDNNSIIPQSDYADLMRQVSNDMCTRSKQVYDQLRPLLSNATELQDLTNLTSKAIGAQSQGSYYSAASYCFGLNVRLRTILYEKQHLTPAKLKSKAGQFRADIERFDNTTRSKQPKTITDLQVLGVVRERLHEATTFLDRLEKENEKMFLLAYAGERYFSAQVWAHFFGIPGREYLFSQEVLRRSCIEKIQEAKERLQYVLLFLPDAQQRFGTDIREAELQAQSGEYELCLISASQAKGDTNAVLSTLGIEDKEVGRLVESKLTALQKLIGRTIQKRAFPLLGYSYYEYAQSLKNHDHFSALLYAEYGLELSNLDIYFESEKVFVPLSPLQKIPSLFLQPSFFFGFGLGFIAAVIFFVLYFGRLKRKNEEKKAPSEKKISLKKMKK